MRKHSIFMVLRVWVLWDVIRGLMYKGSNTGLTKASSLHNKEIQGFLNHSIAGKRLSQPVLGSLFIAEVGPQTWVMATEVLGLGPKPQNPEP